mgnify:CR=1 FL=1
MNNLKCFLLNGYQEYNNSVIRGGGTATPTIYEYTNDTKKHNLLRLIEGNIIKFSSKNIILNIILNIIDQIIIYNNSNVYNISLRYKKSAMKNVNNINNIKIYNNYNLEKIFITDFSFLTNITNLILPNFYKKIIIYNQNKVNELAIAGCDLLILDPNILNNLKLLKLLKVNKIQYYSGTPISGTPISVLSNDTIKLKDLVKLEYLELMNLENINRIILTDLVKLEKIDITFMPNLNSILLKNLSNCKKIKFNNLTKIQDIQLQRVLSIEFLILDLTGKYNKDHTINITLQNCEDLKYIAIKISCKIKLVCENLINLKHIYIYTKDQIELLSIDEKSKQKLTNISILYSTPSTDLFLLNNTPSPDQFHKLIHEIQIPSNTRKYTNENEYHFRMFFTYMLYKEDDINKLYNIYKEPNNEYEYGLGIEIETPLYKDGEPIKLNKFHEPSILFEKYFEEDTYGYEYKNYIYKNSIKLIITQLQEQRHALQKRLSYLDISLPEEHTFSRVKNNSEYEDKEDEEDEDDISGSIEHLYHGNIDITVTLPYESDILDSEDKLNKFQKQHYQYIYIIELILPLIHACFTGVTINCVGDNHYVNETSAKMNERFLENNIIYSGRYRFSQYLAKQKYDEKPSIWGFEFKCLDNIKLDYYNTTLLLLFMLAAWCIDYKNITKETLLETLDPIISTYNKFFTESPKPSVDKFTEFKKEIVKEGWNTPVPDEYMLLLLQEFDLDDNIFTNITSFTSYRNHSHGNNCFVVLNTLYKYIYKELIGKESLILKCFYPEMCEKDSNKFIGTQLSTPNNTISPITNNEPPILPNINKEEYEYAWELQKKHGKETPKNIENRVLSSPGNEDYFELYNLKK